MSKCLRETQIETLVDLAKNGVNIQYVVSDSVSTSKVKKLQTEFPDKVVNVGIAEQNLIGIATGLANGGYITLTGNATPFLISRSAEQLKVDVNYSNSNVKVNGMHAGFSYGLDGCTHHEVTDISFMRGLPNFEIFSPCDPRECRQITEYAVTKRIGPVYISLNSGNFENITPEDYTFVPGKPVQFSTGSDITLIGLGTAVHDILDSLKLHAISADVFSISSIRPLDMSKLIASIKKTKKVVTVEQHSTHGGIGSIIAECIADNGLHAQLKRLGVPEGSFSKNATADYNKQYFGLDAEGIAKTIKKL